MENMTSWNIYEELPPLLQRQEYEGSGITYRQVKAIKPWANQSDVTLGEGKGRWPRITVRLKYLNQVQAM
jgi:hypothetical protein